MDKIFSDVHTLLFIIAYSFYRFYIQSVNSQHFLPQKTAHEKGVVVLRPLFLYVLIHFFGSFSFTMPLFSFALFSDDKLFRMFQISTLVVPSFS